MGKDEIKKFQILVETEAIPGLNKNLFSFRIFSTIDLNKFVIIKDWININEDEKEKIEKEYVKNGLVKVDFLFPRVHFELDKIKTKDDYIKWINYFQFFQRPLETMIKSYYKVARYFKLISINPLYVNLYLRFAYFKKTNAPVVFECLGPMTLFEITAQTDLNEEIELQVGKGSSNYGFGRIKISPIA